MPAVVRGGSPKPRRPRAEAPASPNKARSAAPKGAQPAAKLRAAKGVGLSPAFALGVAGAALGLGLVVMLATGHRAERLVTAARQGVDSEFATAGFKLRTVHIQGASGPAQADILRASGLYLDQPILGLSLAEIRQRVEAVGWVKEAKVVRLLPDTVVIAVKERPALAVWQSGGRMRVIDGEGRVTTTALRNYYVPRFVDLPVTEVLFADTFDPLGPLGAKSMSEAPYNPVAPALANAIRDAMGVRSFELPMSRDRLWRLASARRG